jgi:hypothetical protein
MEYERSSPAFGHGPLPSGQHSRVVSPSVAAVSAALASPWAPGPTAYNPGRNVEVEHFDKARD